MPRGRPPFGAPPPDDGLAELLSFWNRALKVPIAIKSDKPNRLLQRLYAARREAGHNAYDRLRLVEMPDEVRILSRE